MHSRSRLIRTAVIAAIAGSTCGAVAGLWSVHRGASDVTPAAQKSMGIVVATSASASSGADAAVGASARRDVRTVDALVPSVPVPTTGLAGPTAAAASRQVLSGGDDGQNVLHRARALAQRPDVNALLALRDGISRRAEERGEKESPDNKRLLDELDRYLTDARLLRLKLDGDEFRASTAAANPPR
jgi:hypothetical protein